MTAGERVKIVRNEAGLTMEKFGKRLGVTKVTISRIESGVNGLTTQMAKGIAREYGVSYDWLISGYGDMRPTSASGTAAKVAAMLDLSDWATQALTNFLQLDEAKRKEFLVLMEKTFGPANADEILSQEEMNEVNAAGEEAKLKKRAELLDKEKVADA